MAKIIGSVASKGGVGKTTILACIASELAKNFRVAVFDCDNDQHSILELTKSNLLGFDYLEIKNEEEFKKAIKAVSKDYDYIFCDTAPHSHTDAFFLEIISSCDTVIGLTQPAPTDVLAFNKIMVNVLDESKKELTEQKQFLLVNIVEHVNSDIQKESFKLIDELFAERINVLNTRMHRRASFKAHGYFPEDPVKDKKKIIEVDNLVKELFEREGL